MFAAGETATFTLVAHIPAGTSGGTVITNTAMASTPADQNNDNDFSTTQLTVSASTSAW